MSVQSVARPTAASLAPETWAQIGLTAAAASIVAVLIVQALALAIWPQIAAFRPLDSYPRTALFVLVPALAATAVFAWLAGRSRQPARTFLWVAGAVLLLSIIPDFVLPDPNKTVLASSVTAFLHVVAGVITTAVLIAGYRRKAGGI